MSKLKLDLLSNAHLRYLTSFSIFCCQISENGEEKEKYKGRLYLISPYISEGNSISLRFHSDTYEQGQGFSIDYRGGVE